MSERNMITAASTSKVNAADVSTSFARRLRWRELRHIIGRQDTEEARHLGGEWEFDEHVRAVSQ